MGWESSVNADIAFSKRTYNSLSDVESDLKDCEKIINRCKERLIVLASLHPKDLIEKDCEGEEFPIEESIVSKVNEILEEYDEAQYDLTKLELFKSNWHRRSGDFVKSDKYYKFIGKVPFIFTPNKVYQVNVKKGYNNTFRYFVLTDNYDTVEISQEELDTYFVESTEKEY